MNHSRHKQPSQICSPGTRTMPNVEDIPSSGVVISGMAGRFPSSDNIDEFRKNLTEGKDMLADPDFRFPSGLWGLPTRAGRIRDITRFDNEFFGFDKEQADYTDQNLRILFEVVYESIMDAGVNPASLRGSKTAIFCAAYPYEFEFAVDKHPSFNLQMSGGYYQASSRLARYFDFRGPVCNFENACAASMETLNAAICHMKHNLIDQAIVCGSFISIDPVIVNRYLQMQMLSPTGSSRFLNYFVDGYAKGDACVSFFLRRQQVALRNYATILATKSGSDGYKPEGITYPSYKAQETLMREVKELTNVHSDHIEYYEAHGTGTPAGDPVEAKAVTNVYNPDVAENKERTIGPILAGSVKTSMGHAETVAGLCSITKIILMLENEIIYKNLHFVKPNPLIESLMDNRLKLVVENQPLKAKIIPLSSFGFGGSNAHGLFRANLKGINERELDEKSWHPMESWRLILMFGRNRQAVESFFDSIMALETRNKTLTRDFLALVDSLCGGAIDRLMKYRGFMLVDMINQTEIHRSIESVSMDFPDINHDNKLSIDLGRPIKHLQDSAEKPCYFVYCGLGSEWMGMAKGLRNCQAFWSTIERLDLILKSVGYNLIDSLVLDDYDDRKSIIDAVAIQIALTNLLRCNLNIKPTGGIMGHSYGEVLCAYADNVLDERETILLIYHLFQPFNRYNPLIEGTMVAINVDSTRAQKLIDDYIVANHSEHQQTQTSRCTLYISCDNGPSSVTISGSKQHIEEFLVYIKQIDENILFKKLNSDVAYHNPLILTTDIKNSLVQQLKDQYVFQKSSYTRNKDMWLTTIHRSEEVSLDDFELATREANAEYFANNLCSRVDFYQAIKTIPENSVVIEIAPHGLFESIFKETFRHSSKFTHINMMKKNDSNAMLTLFSSIGKMFTAGLQLNLGLANIYPKIDYPVRKQVPSISSLVKWDHTDSFFVPRYPEYFNRSSKNIEISIDLMQDNLKYLRDHKIDGRTLFPGVGYLFYMWKVFSKLNNDNSDSAHTKHSNNNHYGLAPVEFHDVRLERATLLNEDHDTKLTIDYEICSGKFSFKDADTIVCSGIIRATTTTGLDKWSYINHANHNSENSQSTTERFASDLDQEDVYKYFRVNGYDYGESFRCIHSISSNGQHSRVQFKGHLISFLDNFAQSILLAIDIPKATGALLIPISINYLRLEPEKIFDKINQSGVIVEDELDFSNGNNHGSPPAGGTENNDTLSTAANNNTNNICIFESHYEPESSILRAHGIELRGMELGPAPRREINDPLLECYKFVKNIEEPVNDLELSRNAIRENYDKICANLINKFLIDIHDDETADIATKIDMLYSAQDNQYVRCHEDELQQYIDNNLSYRRSKLNDRIQAKSSKTSHHQLDDEHLSEMLVKNKSHSLLSLLDSMDYLYNNNNDNNHSSSNTNNNIHLTNGNSGRKIRRLQRAFEQSYTEHRNILSSDRMQSSFEEERFIKPIMEMVIENSCQSAKKLKLVEINSTNCILYDRLVKYTDGLSVDYTLTHSDQNIKISLSYNEQVNVASLNSLNTSRSSGKSFDAAIFYDSSCCLQSFDDANTMSKSDDCCFKQIINNAGKLIRNNGFFIVMVRHRISVAEAFVLAMMQLIDNEHLANGSKVSKDSSHDLITRMLTIKTTYESRMRLLLAETESHGMRLIAKKMDTTGCSIVMFQLFEGKSLAKYDSQTTNMDITIAQNTKLLRITHQNYHEWLKQLKSEFYGDVDGDNGDTSNPTSKKITMSFGRRVWLCAINTKDDSNTGIIGLMQCLIKEIGSQNLRCFFDCHTFKQRQDSSMITLTEIESSQNFRRALQMDMLWNCIDSDGHWGSYRHFSLSEYLNFNEHDNNNTGSYLVNSKEAFANISTRGDLSSFHWYQSPFSYLDPVEHDKCLTRIKYSALNFRDIMYATGKLSLNSMPFKLALNDCILGIEYSGYDVHSNKRVAGMVLTGSMSTYMITDIRNSIRFTVPNGMSLKEAATIPVAYATTIWAMIVRGKMQPGESILIHAGSGAVGQAAIRLAIYHKVKVFTTVGSEEKRKFLLEEFKGYITDEQIFNSRSCTFETQIMRATHGRGVDLVLNSLSEEKLQASLRCLADNGRFLEIGKHDLALNNKLELIMLDTNKTFHGYLLDKLYDRSSVTPYLLRQLELVAKIIDDGLEKGYVRPIKSTCFSRNELEKAFRFMATGKHIGKVLIEIESEDDDDDGTKQNFNFANKHQMKVIPKIRLSPFKSYIVTGGLGGFGLELTKWLASNGARHIVLTSRTGIVTGYQHMTIERLERLFGCKVLVVTNNVANSNTLEGVEKLFRCAMKWSPTNEVDGVFHLAAVLRDKLFESMSSEDFKLVCEPKADTCILLDKVSRNFMPNMSLFVVFSSIVCGKGNVGQTNYGYANSIMERICEQRLNDNLHGLAIQWGAVGDVGLAHELLGDSYIIGGTIAQRIPSCFSSLEKLLCTPFAICTSSIPVQNKLHQQHTRATSAIDSIAHIMGIKNINIIEEQTTLGELGMDSLMAVEIAQLLERDFNLTLSVQEIRALDFATVKATTNL